jgi:hypothetical protein
MLLLRLMHVQHAPHMHAGELSSLVMSEDQALVESRDRISIVQRFIGQRCLPRSLAKAVVATYSESLAANSEKDSIFPQLSSSLQVEVRGLLTCHHPVFGVQVAACDAEPGKSKSLCHDDACIRRCASSAVGKSAYCCARTAVMRFI